MGEPEKEGWLIKKGGIGGALTKRWFVLIGPLLFYFSSESTDSRAKGVVPLYESEVSEHVVPEKELQKYDKKSQKGGLRIGYCWSVRTRMREFVISSDSAADRKDWMAACAANAALPIEEDGSNPKQSFSTLRKLLVSADQMRKELELMSASKRARPLSLPPAGAPLLPVGDLSPLGSPASSPRDEESSGCLLDNAWRYDPQHGTLKTFDLKTDGSWPFSQEERGLYIDVQYSWTGSKLRPLVGSGTRAEWDGQVFRLSCFPKHQARLVCEYTYLESSRRFEPVNSPKLPIWVLENNVLRNFNGVNVREFPDIPLDGSVPPWIALTVALHHFQWKCEARWSQA